MWYFLFPLAFGVVMATLLSAIYAGQARAEKKLRTDGDIRTYPPLALRLLFLVCGGLFTVAAVIACVSLHLQGETHVGTYLLVVGIFCAFSLMGFFGYAYARFNFVVAKEDGIVSHRLFRRTKFYRYEEIAEYKDSTDRGIYGGLIGYGQNGKKIFAIEGEIIGARAIANRLSEKGVKKRLSLK